MRHSGVLTFDVSDKLHKHKEDRSIKITRLCLIISLLLLTIDQVASCSHAGRADEEPKASERRGPDTPKSVPVAASAEGRAAIVGELAKYLQPRTIVARVQPKPSTDRCVGRVTLPSAYSQLSGAKVKVLEVRNTDSKKDTVPTAQAAIRSADQDPDTTELELTLIFDPASTGRDGKYLVDVEFVLRAEAGNPGALTKLLNADATLTCQVPAAQFETIPPITIEQVSMFMGFATWRPTVWQTPQVILRDWPDDLAVSAKASPATTPDRKPGPGAVCLWCESKQSRLVRPGEPAAIEATIPQSFNLGTYTGTLRLSSPFGEVEVPYTVYAHDSRLMVPAWIILGVGISLLLRGLIPRARGWVNVEQGKQRLTTDLKHAKSHREDDAFEKSINELSEQVVRLDIDGVSVTSAEWEPKSIERLNQLRAQMDTLVAGFEQRRQAAGVRLRSLQELTTGLARFEKPFELVLNRSFRDEEGQLGQGRLGALDARLAEREGGLAESLPAAFEKRQQVLLQEVFKRTTPDLAYRCPNDVKQRWVQGIDVVAESGKTPPSGASELKRWAGFLGGFHKSASTTASTLLSDIRNVTSSTLSNLRLAEPGRSGKGLDQAEASVKALESVKLDQWLEEPIRPGAADEVLWKPLRSTLESVWQLVEDDFETVKNRAESALPQGDPGLEPKKQLEQTKTEFWGFVNSGELEKSFLLLHNFLLAHPAPSAPARKRPYSKLGLGGTTDVEGDDVVPRGITSVVLPPLNLGFHLAPAGSGGDTGVDSRFPWSPGGWDLAQPRTLRLLLAGVETVALVLVAVLVGSLLFMPEFVGGFKDVAALFVWGFGIDLSVNGVISQLKAVK